MARPVERQADSRYAGVDPLRGIKTSAELELSRDRLAGNRACQVLLMRPGRESGEQAKSTFRSMLSRTTRKLLVGQFESGALGELEFTPLF
jgi:hypothetical protein